MNTRFLHSSNPNIRFPTRWSYGARNDYSGDMNYSLSYQVDLRKVLPGRVMVGFSDATGAYVERHILQSWEFNSSLNTVLKGEDNSKEWKLAAGIAVPLGVLVLGSRHGKKENITEVKVISSLRHRNLVRLIGWCHDQTQFLLVYEFMPNGSLDSHLFGQKTLLSGLRSIRSLL
ncbi:putative protein kinase RLK-Pelle-L-LEC family [Helianthus annuus]|nr:putative protein kinase RLK-Pelle-L-LEC family [Helianthus annuus]